MIQEGQRMLLSKTTATGFSLEYSLLIRLVILLSAFTFDFGVKAQTSDKAQKDAIQSNLRTVFDARLRDYNQRSSKPLTSEEAHKILVAFNQRLNLEYDSPSNPAYTIQGKTDWAEDFKYAFEQVVRSNGKNGSPLV